MGKYIIGVFFVIVGCILVMELINGTVPAVQNFGEKINKEIVEYYTGP